MSTAQAPALRTHLQNLCDSGAAIGAFPDRGDLISTWGATEHDIGDLVGLVRQHAPQGYFVPFVCKHTNMKVIMVKGQGHLFTYGLLATMASVSYCRTRMANLARDFRRMAAGFPAGTAFRRDVDNFCTVIDGITAPGYGPMAIAINQLPMLARRASVAERRELTLWATEYAS